MPASRRQSQVPPAASPRIIPAQREHSRALTAVKGSKTTPVSSPSLAARQLTAPRTAGAAGRAAQALRNEHKREGDGIESSGACDWRRRRRGARRLACLLPTQPNRPGGMCGRWQHVILVLCGWVSQAAGQACGTRSAHRPAFEQRLGCRTVSSWPQRSSACTPHPEGRDGHAPAGGSSGSHRSRRERRHRHFGCFFRALTAVGVCKCCWGVRSRVRPAFGEGGP